MADREKLAEKSNGILGGPIDSTSPYYQYGPQLKYKAPSGPSSPQMVNDGNNGGQQPANNGMSSQTSRGQEEGDVSSGGSSTDMVKKGGQQTFNNGMTSQSWPNYGRTQFDQPGYGYSPFYGSYQPMSWNRPMYGHPVVYQPYMPYMYGKK